jgi:glutaredoxin-like protein
MKRRLPEKVMHEVKDALKGLQDELTLVVFTQEFECPTCKDNRMLMEELSSLSNKVRVEVFDFVNDKEKADYYNIEKIPATVVEGSEDYGIRFFGVPGGYEFGSLIHAIKMVSSQRSTLSRETKAQLKTALKPVHIQVFVTLTCPYCPLAVQLAHGMALESPRITSDMVVTTEFPHLTHKYNVFAVPKVIINETIEFEGALAESLFLKHVMMAVR